MNKQQAYNLFIQQALKYGFSLFGTPKTGETSTYYPGCDGAWQKGYPVSGARFVDNDDGTITDLATGLIWTKKVSDLGALWWNGGAPIKRQWTTALNQCNQLDYAGHSDWRLPNAHEIRTIINYKAFNPTTFTIFEELLPDYYWSSTTVYAATTVAHCTYFFTGVSARAPKIAFWYPRPVRGGAPA